MGKAHNPFLRALLGTAFVVPCACAVIPDTTAGIPPASAREGATADDVFMRKPWEIWRVSGRTARFHREAFMLLPNRSEFFEVGDVSVYAADGSDVRLDYAAVDLGADLQSRESISVFVYRAPGALEHEWKSVVDRMKRERPGAKAAEPFPLPEKHPPETKQFALITPDRSGDEAKATFVQVTLFHQGSWAVRYEIACPLVDVDVVRSKTRAFLRSLRALD